MSGRQKELLNQSFDLILFAGQSNMAGRGCVSEATVCQPGIGWEYGAVTDPLTLHPLTEPFGLNENVSGLIDDGEKKSGGMTSAFVAEYYRLTGRMVVCVSASRGGTTSQEWCDGLVQDAAMRLVQAQLWLSRQGLIPSHTLVLWCQGESDGDRAVSAEKYRRNFQTIWQELQKAGAEYCGLIQIGHFNRSLQPEDKRDTQYAIIRDAQLHLVETEPCVFLAGSFAPYETYMKDAFHYHQAAYNEVGKKAAKHVAAFLCRKKT